MTTPAIICVAITGSVPTKADNPAVPITVSEQIESTQEAFEAGATIAHCHVRDDQGRPTSDPDRFAKLKEGIEARCPGMIVQLSTGGRSGAGKTRGGMLPLAPDMASLSVGSNNFPTRVYENPPDLVEWLASEMRTYDVTPEIEAFDLSHIYHAKLMWDRGELKKRPYVQFVMGVKNGDARRQACIRFLRGHGENSVWRRCTLVRSRDWAASGRSEPMGPPRQVAICAQGWRTISAWKKPLWPHPTQPSCSAQQSVFKPLVEPSQRWPKRVKSWDCPRLSPPRNPVLRKYPAPPAS